MTWQSATTLMRRVKPSHEPWKPHGYQKRGVDFLCGQPIGALFFDPGLGKTSVALEAFCQLKQRGDARKMLVIAPLRVCQLVWRQEAQRWTQFRDLTFTLLHGTKKEQLLKEPSDIFLINPEGIAWLSDVFFGRSLPFDVLTVDELTKFKNARAVRHKKLRPRLQGVKRRWGLTGTPIPNGYLDLFGQMLVLDDGACFGKYITHYRDMYFKPDFNGFDWILKEGADARIEKRIAPYVLRMAAADYLELPPLIEDHRYVEMAPGARKVYEAMKRDMLASLEEGTVTASNAGAVYSKLKQMANGAVYIDKGAAGRDVIHIHDEKLDALSDLVEELAGQQLIVGYEFRHDLARLLERFGKDTPYLGAGVSEQRAVEIERLWNAGEISLLLMHPESTGHGLNMQRSGAAHICWFSASWNLESYDQLIRRIYRQGTSAPHVVNHVLLMRDTIDELQLQALQEKDTTQKRLLTALNAEIIKDVPPWDESPATGNGVVLPKEKGNMENKLSRKSGAPSGWGRPAPQEDADEAPEAPAAPRGWGRPAPQEDADDQRGKISRRLRGEPAVQEDEQEEVPARQRAKTAFSENVREKLNEGAAESTQEVLDLEPAPAPVKRGRKPREAGEATPSPAPSTSPETLPGAFIRLEVSGPAEAVERWLSRLVL